MEFTIIIQSQVPFIDGSEIAGNWYGRLVKNFQTFPSKREEIPAMFEWKFWKGSSFPESNEKLAK